jgi:hypothetical protein
MRRRYSFPTLSRADRELHEAVLMDEVHLQGWYTVSWSGLMGREVLLILQ